MNSSLVNLPSSPSNGPLYRDLKRYILTEGQLGSNGYPSADPHEKGKAVVKTHASYLKVSPHPSKRYCSRCEKLYDVYPDGNSVVNEICVYHSGRSYSYRNYSLRRTETRYSCCRDTTPIKGCLRWTTHVSENFVPHNLRDFVETECRGGSAEEDSAIYALDCEMVCTTGGYEIAQVSLVDWTGKTVYETLVKPDHLILDYNTKFSGITEDDLRHVTVTFEDVRQALLKRLSNRTILIGHSLEHDLVSLRMIHGTVIDTSVVFPHAKGAPMKRSLRTLATEFLHKDIQKGTSGHTSAEDALACMDLMLLKVKRKK